MGASPARFALRAEGDESQGSFRYSDADTISPLEKKKAIEDTSKWCLERCISLGHCEVFEDLAKMSTSQVQDFCKACVIGEVQGADECDVQWMFAVRETARRRRISERAARRAAGSDLSGRSGRG